MARGQLKLFEEKNVGEHGGEIQRGKRKSRRPFTAKRPMHVTLRATAAKGSLSFLVRKNANFIKSLLQSASQKRGVTIYRYAIVCNHLHLLVRATTRKEFQDFLKEISGKIARFVTGARRGRAYGKRFFDLLAYSRLVTWGREFRSVLKYIEMNTREALGVIPYQRRKSRPTRGLPRVRSLAPHVGAR